METIRDYVLDEDNRSRIILISVTLAVVIILGLIITSLVAGMTDPYVQPSTNTTTSSSVTNTTLSTLTTSTKSQNLTTVTIGNHTTITKEKASTTFTPPTFSYPDPATMTGYPKTVLINQAIYTSNQDGYYFKGYLNHELIISHIHNGASQSDITVPILFNSNGVSQAIIINLNNNHVTLKMVDTTTLQVIKVVT
jgi:hypothetical protein